MGTNFYVKHPKRIKEDKMDPAFHIGKRSAAGLFCWDCGITLCKNGQTGIHQGCRCEKSPFCNCRWYSTCPKCGKAPDLETLGKSTAGVELGFNKDLYPIKRGVASCCTFTFAMDWDAYLLRHPRQRYVWDEYGDKYTVADFKIMLGRLCPIRRFKLGEWFG